MDIKFLVYFQLVRKTSDTRSLTPSYTRRLPTKKLTHHPFESIPLRSIPCLTPRSLSTNVALVTLRIVSERRMRSASGVSGTWASGRRKTGIVMLAMSK